MKDKTKTSSASCSSSLGLGRSKKVRVVARIRPFLPGENALTSSFSSGNGQRVVIARLSANEIAITSPRNSAESIKFTLDSCFDEHCDQLTLFQEEIFPLLTLVMQGINVSIFAYGNTGAGKTFTMLGCEKKHGIIPRTVRQLFTIFNAGNKGCKYELKVSFFEIYNEKVYDLIKFTGQDLGIREDAQRQILIPGLSVETPGNFEEFQALFASAIKNRSTAATSLNANSSRSHSVLMIVVETAFPNGSVMRSKIHLIDLAGSEDNRKTDNSGIRMVESSAINKSLFVLGNVVDALNAGGEQRVPYRDSKLTRILQDSLGGKSQSLMIANLSPCERFLLESHNTLCFATKSRQVCNQVVQQMPQKPQSPPSFTKHSSSIAQFMARNKGECTFLLSPMLKRRRVVSEELADRCEALERKLILKEGKIPIDASKKLSPSAKASIKSLNTQLKDYENNFDYAKAIECAKSILSIAPWDAKAEKKLEALKRTHDSILCQMVKASNESPAFVPKAHNSADVSSGSAVICKGENLENVFSTPISQLIPSPSQVAYSAESESLRKRRVAEAELLYIFNTGTKNDLLKVKGIGKKRAEQIAAFRITKGAFQTLEDFLQVEGVTQKILDNILLLKVAETVLSE